MKFEKIFEKYLLRNSSAFFYTPSYYKNSKSFIFQEPSEIILASNKTELFTALELINSKLNNGMIGYGYITYEAGYLLENKLEQFYEEDGSLILKFCLYNKNDVEIIKSSEIDFTSGGFDKKFSISSFGLNTSKNEFTRNINEIKKYITEGDTYQVNYTIKGKFNYSGAVVSLYKLLLFNQSAKYSAFINDDDNIIISLSPELFFDLNEHEIITKPMKGTIKRGSNLFDDKKQKRKLYKSIKNQAENIMIVDLLRNDFGKIAKYNSVRAEKIFSVEKYESLFQMVSEVKARLKSKAKFSDVIPNIFPCGSITGAPKIRTMEIIKSLEKEKRGLYTGTIGLINRDQTIFNVAIRTIVLNKKERKGEIGIGSGIVIDSDPDKEYEETLLKNKFLTEPDPYFELFETMLVKNKKVFLMDEHLKRLNNAAGYFLFIYNRTKIIKMLTEELDKTNKNKKYRLKLILDKWGGIRTEMAEFKFRADKVNIILSQEKISSENKFQYFKTTNRNLYNRELEKYKNGFFDVIFLNEKNILAEGAITNIFVKLNDRWFTPSLDCGILSGVYRKYFIKNSGLNIKETFLTETQLKEAEEIILTNSLREKIKVGRLYFSKNVYKDFN